MTFSLELRVKAATESNFRCEFLRYEDVYTKLLLKFDWKRLVALTEDGMKYTQYISDMEQNLKDKGINLMINKKFSRVNDKERQLENFKTVSQRKISACASSKSSLPSQVSQRAQVQPVSRQNHHR
jgi:hypothetical protein